MGSGPRVSQAGAPLTDHAQLASVATAKDPTAPPPLVIDWVVGVTAYVQVAGGAAAAG